MIIGKTLSQFVSICWWTGHSDRKVYGSLRKRCANDPRKWTNLPNFKMIPNQGCCRNNPKNGSKWTWENIFSEPTTKPARNGAQLFEYKICFMFSIGETFFTPKKHQTYKNKDEQNIIISAILHVFLQRIGMIFIILATWKISQNIMNCFPKHFQPHIYLVFDAVDFGSLLVSGMGRPQEGSCQQGQISGRQGRGVRATWAAWWLQ